MLSRSIRQGCPLSSLLFILVAEILAIKVRSNKNVEGFKIDLDRSKPLKITQLADDTTLFVRNEKEITDSLALVEEYGKHSGLNLNRKKTEGLWIGSSKTFVNTPGGIKWSKEVKALGVYFGHSKENCIKLNWDSKYQQCEKIIENWKKRKLTFYGKITIIKTLLLPKFTYQFHSNYVPENVIKKINSLFFNFLWEGKREKIKRNTLIGSKHEGGLGMIDIKSYIQAIKTKWIQKLLSERSDASWTVIPRYFLNQYGENFLVFYMNIDTFKNLPPMKPKLPTFYLDIVKTWIEFTHGTMKKPNYFYEIRKQLLWGNYMIKNASGKLIIFQHWIKSGILFVNDVVSQNGTVDETIIYNKLKNKKNWIAETNILKAAISRDWKQKIKTQESINTKVKTYLTISLKSGLEFQKMNNKDLYNIFIKTVFEKPYIHRYWENKFLIEDNINWTSVYFSIYQCNVYNNIKAFKYKLIHNIIVTNKNLYKWKIADSPNCLVCKCIEDYEHFFLTCRKIEPFWQSIANALCSCGISKDLRQLQYIVLGYKTPDYSNINLLINVVSYSLYKSYLVSERRLKECNILCVFKNELKLIIHTLSAKRNAQLSYWY